MKNFNLFVSVIFTVLLFSLVSCYKESTYYPYDDPPKISSYLDSILVITDTDSIPADSISTTRIIIELPYNADSTKSTVTIRTDLGNFEESGTQSVTITAKNNTDSVKKIAIITLKSGNIIGTAHIQCNFFSVIKNLTIAFYNSYPDFLNLSASTLDVKPSTTLTGEVSFICKLYKSAGVPSQRNVVNLTVTDTNFQSIGSFRSYNNLSDQSESSQFTYILGDSLSNGFFYYGKLYAIASVKVNSSGMSISDTLNFWSTK